MSDHDSNPGAPPPPRPPWPKLLPPLLALLVLVSGVSFLALRGSSPSAPPGGAGTSGPGSGYEGTLTLPAKRAPAIGLHNYLGRPVTLAQYRGRAVLVTFLYTHCPDICPLIASNLRVALNMLGPRAQEAQVIVISVDPRGDTRGAVARFMHEHQLTGRTQYLVGSAGELGRTWAAWGVGSTRDAGQPQLVSHSALVYGVSASGRLMTIYPATFEPAEIVHDVPRLAAG